MEYMEYVDDIELELWRLLEVAKKYPSEITREQLTMVVGGYASRISVIEKQRNIKRQFGKRKGVSNGTN